MSKYLNPRTLYLAALGLTAMVTVDLVRRVRSQEFDMPDTVSDTVGAVTRRVSSTAGAVTARAGKMVDAVRPGRTDDEDVEIEIIEVDLNTRMPVKTGSSADAAAVTEAVDEAIAEAAEVVAEEVAAADTEDLTEIKGIGPTYARRLQAVGIVTYADVAAADPEYLREVTRATGAQADPEAWIAEAQALS